MLHRTGHWRVHPRKTASMTRLSQTSIFIDAGKYIRSSNLCFSTVSIFIWKGSAASGDETRKGVGDGKWLSYQFHMSSMFEDIKSWTKSGIKTHCFQCLTKHSDFRATDTLKRRQQCISTTILHEIERLSESSKSPIHGRNASNNVRGTSKGSGTGSSKCERIL